jgi:hypothetical protein
MKNEREQAIEELANWIAELPIGVFHKAQGTSLLEKLLQSPPPGWQRVLKEDTVGSNLIKR